MRVWKDSHWALKADWALIVLFVIILAWAWGCSERTELNTTKALIDAPQSVALPPREFEDVIIDGYDTTWLWWPVYSHSQIIPSQGPEQPPDTIIGDTHYIHVRIQDLPVGMIRSDTPVWLPPQF